MPRRDDRSLAAILLTQRLEPLAADPLRAREYWDILNAEPDLEALLAADAEEIALRTGVPGELAERVRTLFDGATAVAFALDRAEQAGMHVVASVDDAYPECFLRLGRAAPPLVYAFGDLGLMDGPNLGVVGSRNVDPAGAEVAVGAALAAFDHGHGIVSGAAKGVDQLAMGAVLEAGGRAVGVLADSLLRIVRDTEMRTLIGAGRVLLCSPYKPDAGFSVANAMGRNKLIYALSAATLVVASDHEKGGTWAGAIEALRQKLAQVLVWTGDGGGPGNRPLVDRGATSIDDLADLFPLPDFVVEATLKSPTSQLSLDV